MVEGTKERLRAQYAVTPASGGMNRLHTATPLRTRPCFQRPGCEMPRITAEIPHQMPMVFGVILHTDTQDGSCVHLFLSVVCIEISERAG